MGGTGDDPCRREIGQVVRQKTVKLDRRGRVWWKGLWKEVLWYEITIGTAINEFFGDLCVPTTVTL